jgi:anti-sigma B factor antagonist
VSQASVVPSSTTASCRPAPPPFFCRWTEGGSDAAWVHLAGELDLANTPQLERTLREAQRHAHLVVLDLRGLTFIESSGIHVILDAAGSVRPGDGRLIVVRGPAHVDLALTLTGASKEILVLDLESAKAPVRALHLA